jgi:hypothetical protein
MSSEPTQEHLYEEYINEEPLDEEFFDENYVNQNYVKIPDWHMEIIQERMARFESEDKSKWRTWEEFEKELLDKLARSLKK